MGGVDIAAVMKAVKDEAAVRRTAVCPAQLGPSYLCRVIIVCSLLVVE